jgi:uncharacterized surface protein with fasciclin (FAS1) repeats
MTKSKFLFGAAAIALGIGSFGPAQAQIIEGTGDRAPSSCTEIDIGEAQQRLAQIGQNQQTEAQRLIQAAQDARVDGDRQRCAQYLSQFEELLPADARRAAANQGGRQGSGSTQAAQGQQTQQAENVLAAIRQQGNLNSFAQALQTAGMADTLGQGGPYTIFAPTDQAFNNLPQDARNRLMDQQNRDQLRTLIGQHIIQGRSIASDAIPERLQPMDGQPILVDMRNNAPVLRTGPDGEARDVRQAIDQAERNVEQALQQVQDQQAQQQLRQARESLREAEKTLSANQQTQTQQNMQERQQAPDQQAIQQVSQSIQNARQALQQPGDQNQQQARHALDQAQQPLQQALNQASGQQQQRLQQIQQAIGQAQQSLQNQNPQQAQQALDQTQQPLQQVQVAQTQQDQTQPSGSQQGNIHQARVVLGDIRTGNGIVHGIDTVLIPDNIQDMIARQ